MTEASRRFPPKARLRNAREFKRVFENPLRSSTQTLTVLARSNGTAGARLGLAIAKKHVRRAVDRNRVKRVLREDFRHHQTSLAGLDIVVLARHGLDRQSVSDLRVSLRKHWQRLTRLSAEYRRANSNVTGC